jgi:hypothetical protein
VVKLIKLYIVLGILLVNNRKKLGIYEYHILLSAQNIDKVQDRIFARKHNGIKKRRKSGYHKRRTTVEGRSCQFSVYRPNSIEKFPTLN